MSMGRSVSPLIEPSLAQLIEEPRVGGLTTGLASKARPLAVLTEIRVQTYKTADDLGAVLFD